jgi:hypothetical protein
MNATETTCDLLRDELSRLNGTKFDGARSILFFPFDRPTKYLSGYPYLFTGFAERAYELGENTANELIAKYPDVLGDATVLKVR